MVLREAGSNARIPENYPEMLRMTALKALLAADRSDQAFDLYRGMIEDNPEMLDIWVLATTMTEPYEARRALEKVEPVLGETLEGQVLLVKTLLVIAEKSQEETDIVKALDAINDVRGYELSSNVLELELYESSLLTLLGRYEDAMALLQELVAQLEQSRRTPISTDDDSDAQIYVTALNNLSYLYATHRSNGAEDAQVAITKALAIAPNQYRGSLLDTKALIDLKSGNCTGAESSINQAIALQPGNLDYQFRRLEVLIGCDQIAEAESNAISIQEQLLSAPQTDVGGLSRISNMLDEIQATAKMN